MAPADIRAYNNLANLLVDRGQIDEAIVLFRRALALKPAFAEGHNNLGMALVRKGQIREAVQQFRAAAASQPQLVQAHDNLGWLLEAQHDNDQAAAEYQKALTFDPQDLRALRSLASIRATSSNPRLRNGDEAVALAKRAKRLCKVEIPDVLDALAAAYAEVGRFDEAVANARRALELAQQQQRASLVETLRGRLSRYQAGLPARR